MTGTDMNTPLAQSESIENGAVGEAVDDGGLMPNIFLRIVDDKINRAVTLSIPFLSALDSIILAILFIISFSRNEFDVKSNVERMSAKEEAGRLLIVFYASLVVLFVNVILATLFLIRARSHHNNASNYLYVMLIKYMSLYMSALVVRPSVEDLFPIMILLPILYFLETILLCFILLRSTYGRHEDTLKVFSSASKVKRTLIMLLKPFTPAAKSLFRTVERREVTKTVLNYVTEHRVKKFITQHHFQLVALFAILIMSGTFTFHFLRLVTMQRPVLVLDDVQEMRNTPLVGRQPDNAALHRNNKVLVVVMDGLRLDYFDRMRFWNDPAYQSACVSNCVQPSDLRVWQMQNQLPSMSVPNWLTFLTGTPPEITGVVGNLLIPDTEMESIYSAARTSGLKRFITGTPWFANIIKSQLDFFCSDGTVSASHGSEETIRPSAAPADQQRLKTALEALDTKGPVQFSLLLAHFSDIDNQGHCCGVTEKYNKDNTYVSAIANKTVALQQLMETVDDSTVVVMVSDHGHVDAGGHGGINKKLRRVPLMIYKRNSNLRGTTPQNTTFAPDEGSGYPARTNDGHLVDSTDIAPTIAALLGTSMPGQAFGRIHYDLLDNDNFIPPAQRIPHLQDLAASQRRMFIEIARKHNLRESYITSVSTDGCTTTSVDEPVLSEERCHQVLEAQWLGYSDLRRAILAQDRATSISLSVIIILSFFLVAILVLKYFTLAEQGAAFNFYGTRTAREENRKAWGSAMLTAFVYYLVVILFYWVFYAAKGYPEFDSSVIHTPAVIPRFMIVLFVPGIVVAFLLTRIHAYWFRRLPAPEFDTWRLRVLAYLSDDYARYGDPPQTYLYDIYLLYVATCTAALVAALGSFFSFVIPGSEISLWAITDRSWPYRFRIIAVMGMSVPLMVIAISKSLTWDWKLAGPDGYEMFRDLRHWRPVDHVIEDKDQGKRLYFADDTSEHVDPVSFRSLFKRETTFELRHRSTRSDTSESPKHNLHSNSSTGGMLDNTARARDLNNSAPSNTNSNTNSNANTNTNSSNNAVQKENSLVYDQYSSTKNLEMTPISPAAPNTEDTAADGSGGPTHKAEADSAPADIPPLSGQ